MRIIPKFSDYYDGACKSYQDDLLYVRDHEVLIYENNASGVTELSKIVLLFRQCPS